MTCLRRSIAPATPSVNEVVGFEVPAIFLDPDADVTLKSSDGVTFKVFKSFLVFGSRFFRKMFQDAKPDSDQAELVPWSEPADLVLLLLYQLYPIPKPDLESLDQLIRVFRAADKWEMDHVVSALKPQLVTPRFIDSDPIAVFHLGKELNMSELEKKAIHRLIAIQDPMDKAFRSNLRGFTALELADWYDRRLERQAVVTRTVNRHLYCGQDAEYPLLKNMRGVLKERMGQRLTGDAVDWSLINTLIRFTSSTYCRKSCCNQKLLGDRLRDLQKELLQLDQLDDAGNVIRTEDDDDYFVM